MLSVSVFTTRTTLKPSLIILTHVVFYLKWITMITDEMPYGMLTALEKCQIFIGCANFIVS